MIEISAQGIRNLREEIIGEDYPRDMGDKKAARLINLTLALLATRRFITKEEIFRSVEGYEGNNESMDRMFERDKNDLRKLGIEIAVTEIDPLFADEVGYRIKQSDFQFQLPKLTPIDAMLIASALSLWQDPVLRAASQSGLIKLESLDIGISNQLSEVINFEYQAPTENLHLIMRAIDESSSITFDYDSSDVKREIQPYKVLIWRGIWYLIGKDAKKEEIRTFKISKILSEVKIINKKISIPSNFEPLNYLPTEKNYLVDVRIEPESNHVLRSLGRLVKSDGEFDYFQIPFHSKKSALGQMLKYGHGARVDSPSELIADLQNSLKRISNV